MPPPMITTLMDIGAPAKSRRSLRFRGDSPGSMGERRNDAARLRDVSLEALDEVRGRVELDVGVQVFDEPELDSLLIEVALEVEQECLHAQESPSECRPVADREGGDEVLLAGAHAPGIGAERRDQLVRLDGDVGGGKAQ